MAGNPEIASCPAFEKFTSHMSLIALSFNLSLLVSSLEALFLKVGQIRKKQK
jgi:hypothetical protein